MKYHIQGKKEQPSTKNKAALNVILHNCTKTRDFSRYMGIVSSGLPAKTSHIDAVCTLQKIKTVETYRFCVQQTSLLARKLSILFN